MRALVLEFFGGSVRCDGCRHLHEHRDAFTKRPLVKMYCLIFGPLGPCAEGARPHRHNDCHAAERTVDDRGKLRKGTR